MHVTQANLIDFELGCQLKLLSHVTSSVPPSCQIMHDC
jgi:hypothetical protein